MNPQLWLQYLI